MSDLSMFHALQHEGAMIALVREQERIEALYMETFRPSMLYKPKLSIDGNQWCALYGDNLQDGVAGFGDSPDAAYRAFDNAWYEKVKP